MRIDALLAVFLTLGSTSRALAQEPYTTRDEIEGSRVSLTAYPIRPMTYRPATGVLWAVNNHDNTLQRFDTAGSSTPVAPNLTRPLPWAPVSIAYWEGPNGSADETDDELIVTCRGSWAVVSVSASDGRITDVVQLPASRGPALTDSEALIGRMAEPGDVIVDEANDRAFVSCTASDSVIQIDLLGARKLVTRVYHVSSHAQFRCKSPLFLSFDSDGKVLASPLTSGNGSTWNGGLASGTAVVDASPAAPDEDLFKIDPAANTVAPVATKIGSTIFAHARNPVTGEVWVLNTNGLNTSPMPQSEPELNGDFLHQGIARLTSPVQIPVPPATLPAPIDLDPALSVLTPGQLPAANVIGQPFALAFNSSVGGGQAFVAGVLTDNVLVLNSAGNFLREFELPAITHERAIPRGVLVKSTASATVGTVLVYAWGHNKVYELSYDLSSSSAPALRAFDLGRDPTPRTVRRGRAQFFDGTNSLHEQVSCASCHIDGGSDLLVWNLSHKAPLVAGGTTPVDDKGGMVTQTLVGLERVAPFHWRGERELIDFNPAFAGLLGGAELAVAAPGALPLDFDELQAFIFSLANPANPNQQRNRTLPTSVAFDDRGEFAAPAGTPPVPQNLILTAHPANGQAVFNNERAFKGAFKCADCHPQPTGTNNGIHIEVVGESQVRRSRLKPAAFHELWRKDLQPRLYTGPTSTGDAGFDALLGGGITHTGTFVDLLEFANAIFVPSDGFAPPAGSCPASSASQCVSDVTAFVERWDSGLGQAAHFVTRLAATQDPATRDVIGRELVYLTRQAKPGALDPWGPSASCDISVFSYMNGSSVPVHWVYRRASDAFFHQDGSTTRTLLDFINNVAAPGSTEQHVFVGLPVGRGEGFGVDQDNDGYVTALDSHPLNATLPGTTAAPALLAGSLDVPWITTRTARLRFETVEPTTALVRYWPHGTTGFIKETARTQLSRVHAFMLPGLLSSTEIGPETGGVANVPIGTLTSDVTIQYAGEILLSNASGQAAAPIPFGPSSDTTTKPFLFPTFGLGASNAEFNPQADIGDHQRQHEHLVSASSFDWITRDSGVIAGKLDFEVSFVRGGRFNTGGTSFDREPAPDRVVIGRLLSKQASSSAVRRVDAITPGLNTEAADLARLRKSGATPNCGVQLDLDGANAGNNFAGRLLFSSVVTDANGDTSIEFSFTDTTLTTNDELWFVVDAVVEVDPELWGTLPRVVLDDTACLNGSGQPIPGTGTNLQLLLLPALTFSYQFTNQQGQVVTVDNGQIAWTQWSFPETGEERALVKGDVP